MAWEILAIRTGVLFQRVFAAENGQNSIGALGNITTTVYDVLGQSKAVVNALGNRTSFSFDAAGRKIAERNPLNQITTTIYDLAGNTRATVDALAHRTTNLFDAINRKIAVIDGNLHRTTLLYDLASNVKATIDANLHRVTNIYDVNNRRIALVDPRGNRTSFAFDLAGNEILVKDALGNRTTSVFDALNRKIKRTDARNNRTSFAYDAASRQTLRKYPDATRVTQVYDVMGNRTLLSDATGRYTAVFDPLDRMSRRTGPANKCITYIYDAVSQRRRTTDPDGGIVTTVYDKISEITQIQNAQALRTTFAYDAAGRRTVKKIANAARTSFSYDNASRVTRLVNIKSSGVTISSFGYQYDKTTRRTGVTEATGDRVTWVYDPAYQLVNERRGGVNNYNVTYTYDPMGNRTLKNDSGALTTSTYDLANRLKYAQDSTGRTTFVFDATGNRAKQTSPALAVTTSVWDFENLNTVVLLPSGTRVTSVYNGDKLRVAKNTASSTANFIYDGQNILSETDVTNLTQAVYTLEPKEFGNLISQIQLQMGLWVQIYYAFDALGSTDSLTDANAVITDTYTYFAFGAIKISTGTTPNRCTWVGQLLYIWDPETGRFVLHRRQLDPLVGRMTSDDPVGTRPDANRQRYLGNDPVNLTDPSGLSPKVKTALELIQKAVKSRAAAIGRRAGTDLLKQFGEQYYKMLRKRLVKLRLSTYFQRHHIILQGVWKRHARFLKQMGFSKNAPSNILLLPTEAGKKLMKEALEKAGGSTAGILAGKYSRRLRRALHSGRNLDDYADVVETVVKDIKNEFTKGVIKKEEAQAQLRALQDVTREFLIEGKIVLQKSELDDMLKKGIVYSTGAGLFFLQASEADAQEQVNDQLNDPADPDGEALRWIRAYFFTLAEMTPKMEAGRAAAKPFTVQHWTGETGAAGWAGWAADIFNPFTLPADVIDISQMAGELAIWYELPERARELLSDEQLIEDAASGLE